MVPNRGYPLLMASVRLHQDPLLVQETKIREVTDRGKLGGGQVFASNEKVLTWLQNYKISSRSSHSGGGGGITSRQRMYLQYLHLMDQRVVARVRCPPLSTLPNLSTNPGDPSALRQDFPSAGSHFGACMSCFCIRAAQTQGVITVTDRSRARRQ